MALTKINNNTLSAVTTLPSAIATGKVLQVVSTQYASNLATTSTSLVATGYTATLTPSSTSSKILISCTGGKIDYDSGTTYIETHLFGKIGGAAYSDISGLVEGFRFTNAYTNAHSISYLWSPSTTSEVIVQPYFKSSEGSNFYFNRSNVKVTVTAMEIGA